MTDAPRESHTQGADNLAAELKCWKKHKSNFKDFVLEYNAGKVQLNTDEKAALVKLHGMWNKVNFQTNPMEYFEMKDHHTVINQTLLYDRPNEAWRKYIKEFQVWRCRLLVDMHQYASERSQQQGARPEYYNRRKEIVVGFFNLSYAISTEALQHIVAANPVS